MLLVLVLLLPQGGVASFYQPKPQHVQLYGTQLLAAHKTLRPGTIILVQSQRTGKVVQVTIAGRGPFVRGRVIDLSREAFRRIELPSRGVVKVRYWRLR